jgi:hypothetical protein
MFRLLVDENFDHDIVRGLRLLSLSDIDLISVGEAGLTGAEDPDVLTWAAGQARILLTHDRKTIPKYAYERINKGSLMPGVFVVPQVLPIGTAIEDLALIFKCSRPHEWQNIVQFIPL